MSKAKTKPPVVSEEEYQRRHARWMFVVASIVGVCKLFLICATAVACFYVTFALPVQIAHGEMTSINVVQSWVVNLDAQIVVSWGLAATAVGYGLNERRLRHKERTEKDARIAKLETAKDPGCTSSKINQKGDPKKSGDKP
jgi:hypothetical protein